MAINQSQLKKKDYTRLVLYYNKWSNTQILLFFCEQNINFLVILHSSLLKSNDVDYSVKIVRLFLH